MENRRREIVFWLGLGYIIYSDWFLLPSLRARHNRSLQLLEHSDHQARVHPPDDFESTIIYRFFSYLRWFIFCLFVSFLISNELSFLYCSGHTVFSYILTAIAKYFASRERFQFAERFLRLALWWDQIWLSEHSVEIQSLLQLLVDITTKSNQPSRFRHYSSRLLSTQRAILNHASLSRRRPRLLSRMASWLKQSRLNLMRKRR
jgi:hypothetical protein